MWSHGAFPVRVYNVPPSKGDTGEPYLPAWWRANLDLRRSLDYIKHWQIGSKSADLHSQQHDTGIDPSMGIEAGQGLQAGLAGGRGLRYPGALERYEGA